MRSNYSTFGEKCLQVTVPASEEPFKSVYINNLPANPIGYTAEFDIYYPSTNTIILTVRFWETGGSNNVNVNVNPSNSIQHISISMSDEFNPDVQGDYMLQFFVRVNAVQIEYWISNIKIYKR